MSELVSGKAWKLNYNNDRENAESAILEARVKSMQYYYGKELNQPFLYFVSQWVLIMSRQNNNYAFTFM